MTRLLINTVLLEKNRWGPGRTPTILASKWLETFWENDFDGVELWENHALKASNKEVQLLKQSRLPLEVFNSYVRFDDQFEEERKLTAEMINQLGAKKVKFNIGPDQSLQETYIKNVLKWKDMLPAGCKLLCECHHGTVMEDPKKAKEIFDKLNSDQFGLIIHPFHDVNLELWFSYFGPSIIHAHVSLYKNGDFQLLEKQSELVKERIRILKEVGFKGTYSLEFTEGVRSEGETPQLLYENALRDSKFLSDCLKEIYVSY
ncbi:sugar phosphate isomerase/epimerase family protein [Virgibacillus sp. L01]|uniref:sugar phosphate isomerase/epimerase family protein n=1 Tax=Virgibacillus sp. L01 TaxID=3457429 RepID=UPI003FD64FB7